MNKTLLLGASIALASLTGCNSTPTKDVSEQTVLDNYSDIAFAVYSDSLETAKALKSATDALVANPSEETLQNAKDAWKAARVPYQQSEVFRFGNSVVDDWEGDLNAWPLDEGLIDYVAASYNRNASNLEEGEEVDQSAIYSVITNNSLDIDNDGSVDTAEISASLIASLHELRGGEANVSRGYHAVEFLLWGQDLNGTNAGAGNRPFTDYVNGEACTNGTVKAAAEICVRRGQYLTTAMDMMIEDLESMVAEWNPEADANYRATLVTEGQTGIKKVLTGIGELAGGELAGERMRVALVANDPEDEHDCFSDNTHYSHYYDIKGIQNVYLGRYVRVNGDVVEGPSVNSLIASKNTDVAKKLEAQIETARIAVEGLVTSAESETNPQTFDQLIASGNKEGNKIVQDSINSLLLVTEVTEAAAKEIGITEL
ncbi:imelysin family protein [Litoribrevibacter albus]|uniref:Peptidase n=1 Tax=Litoribrevibacter albus TaxID=1473156 RepID=A0AA37S7N2_9GAMM|nr:imelysin family protein [Litoribrevibacter albus]GLQ29768.1 peptidase [Litoribrevibacter albus]